MNSKAVLAIVAVQVVCAALFTFQIVTSILGFAPYGWQLYELIEIGAALGLLLGSGLGWVALRSF